MGGFHIAAEGKERKKRRWTNKGFIKHRERKKRDTELY